MESNESPVQTPAAADERPVLREFGSPAAKASALKFNGMTKKVALAGAVSVVIFGGALVLKQSQAPKAPEFKAAKVAAPEQQMSIVPAASAQAASPASAAASSAVAVETAEPVLLANQLPQATEWSTLAAPKTMQEALAQIEAYKSRVTELDLQLEESKTVVSGLEKAFAGAKAREKQASDQSAKAAKAKAPAKASKDDDYVAISILSASPDQVVITESSRPNAQIAVKLGAQLPGGAVFLGYDPQSHVMRTDVGEFTLP